MPRPAYQFTICLDEIDRAEIFEFNGKKYIRGAVWLNDAPDQFGKVGSLTQDISQERRQAGEKSPRIGSLKPTGQKARHQNPPPQSAAPRPRVDDDDEIPF